MGLMRAIAAKSPPPGKPKRVDCKQLVAGLEDSDAAVRRHSARDMGHCAGAVSALAGRLKREENVAVREAILDTLAKQSDPLAVDELVTCLRSEDAALRNEVIETLKHLPMDLSPTLKTLLGDADPDLRIFAVNILESRCEPDVEQLLIEVIERDANVNVCAAAADLLCELGSVAALSPLKSLKSRFASETYIQFAADLAIKRIRES
jgi:HEAT repeat protein